jgi:hypothetical protein
MITVTFETKRFRVQIVGKSAWVESSEGTRWIFRNQHSLPLALDALQARHDSATAVLRSAVEHFERTHDGDLALREALTGVRNVAKLEKSKAPLLPAVRSNPAQPLLRSGLPGRVSSRPKDFRTPLRPPLTAH